MAKRKKTKILLAVLISIAGIVILLALGQLLLFQMLSGGRKMTVYPFEISDCWVSESPTFEYCNKEINGKRVQVSTIHWGNEIYAVNVGFRATSFVVYATYSGQEGYYPEDVLLKGTWEIKDDVMVFTITEDRIFDGAYKELVFVPH